MASGREDGNRSVVDHNDPLPVLVECILSTLPGRLVPSRGFVSACLEFAVALADAWLAAVVGAADGAWGVAAGRVQVELDDLIGSTCARAWWEDAAERVPVGPQASERGDSAQHSESRHVEQLQRLLIGRMKRGAALVSAGAGQGLAASSSSSSGAAGPQESWLRFGAAFVSCALDDVVGAVSAYTARKANVPKPQPFTSPYSRPGTAFSRPMTGAATSRPTTAGVSSDVPSPTALAAALEGSVSGPGRGRVRAHAASAAPATAQPRLRLLALKHFVAAVRADEGLNSCTVLATALAEVATGTAPYAEESALIAVSFYQDRLLSWATQEAKGSGPDGLQKAIAEAMKVSVATERRPTTSQVELPDRPGTASQRPLTQGGFAAAAGEPPSVACSRPGTSAARPGLPADSAMTKGIGKGASSWLPQRGTSSGGYPGGGGYPAAGKRGGWLPKVFVREFNAEGEEVERVSEEDSDEDDEKRAEEEQAAQLERISVPTPSAGNLEADLVVQSAESSRRATPDVRVAPASEASTKATSASSSRTGTGASNRKRDASVDKAKPSRSDSTKAAVVAAKPPPDRKAPKFVAPPPASSGLASASPSKPTVAMVSKTMLPGKTLSGKAAGRGIATPVSNAYPQKPPPKTGGHAADDSLLT
eukprot:TRINITY_DN16050_c0_g1_i1.p1 TRINITY_DN16050_c0_g1~~TRINITY_DN16050_c0_g1_i1.p1  ORF type:complete len:650 (-),score=150.48 TRINITY_DN16050_c0_g1_i1:99-2048(-)